MNRYAIFGTLSALGLGLLALSWPARIEQAPARFDCRPGSELIFANATERADHVSLTGFPWWVKARLGDRELSVKRQWGGFRLQVPSDFPEGKTLLTVQLGGVRAQDWQCPMVVDATPPQLRLVQPAADMAIAGQWADLIGYSEGRFKLHVPLKEGWNVIKLSSRDRAGNSTRLERRVFSDRVAPTLSLERLLVDGNSEPLRGKDSPKDSFRVRVLIRDDSGAEKLRYRLDGGQWVRPPLGQHEGMGQVIFPLRGLAEGTRRLEFECVDRAGRKVTEEAEFVVDSSEVMGTKTMTLGARGQDVYQLQERLHEAGALGKANINGNFDEVTEAAVRRFQGLEGLPETGRVGSQTLLALGPRVFVNLAAFELVLDRPGESPRRFGVACGQPAWPTPTGRFKVWDKVKDPSWIPPDSPWAREAETIPPGPSNPLGTRWIGLDWGGVGIHGTNADWSIGSASSHGCLRMHIYDVEALYDLLAEGTPVTIFSGGEPDPMLRRYWP